jgi:hypothetical protein
MKAIFALIWGNVPVWLTMTLTAAEPLATSDGYRGNWCANEPSTNEYRCKGNGVKQ